MYTSSNHSLSVPLILRHTLAIDSAVRDAKETPPLASWCQTDPAAHPFTELGIVVMLVCWYRPLDIFSLP